MEAGDRREWVRGPEVRRRRRYQLLRGGRNVGLWNHRRVGASQSPSGVRGFLSRQASRALHPWLPCLQRGIRYFFFFAESVL